MLAASSTTYGYSRENTQAAPLYSDGSRVYVPYIVLSAFADNSKSGVRTPLHCLLACEPPLCPTVLNVL